jgi:glycosyltransferase involved in cell wall biosynthesis
VLVPIRNEAGHIEDCLQSLLNSDWPAERMEILVIDGMSDDQTPAIVADISQRDSRVRMIQNPQRAVPFAMNKGIREAAGDIVVRVDGHAEVEPLFVRNSVEQLLQRPECWCVGGVIESINNTIIGRVIAAAMSCPVGVGNSRFRIGGYEGYVDTLAFGAYWKWAFEKAGMFDEELVRNQDDELNARILEQGGKIYLSQSIRSRYFPRTSLRKLWKQYYQYGVWRIRTLQKRGSASLRYMIPMVFVLTAVLALVVGAASPTLRPFALGFGVAYVLALGAGALMVARREGVFGLLLSPLVFAILHFSYGIGSLFGVYWFGLRGRRTLTHGLSR